MTLTFDEWHDAEYRLALAYARKGRECAELREWAADQVERLFDSLEQQYARQEAG